MAIYPGTNNKVDKVYVGSTQISKIYVGNVLVYPEQTSFEDQLLISRYSGEYGVPENTAVRINLYDYPTDIQTNVLSVDENKIGLASTATKLWVNDYSTTLFYEYNMVQNPFSLTYNRTIAYPTIYYHFTYTIEFTGFSIGQPTGIHVTRTDTSSTDLFNSTISYTGTQDSIDTMFEEIIQFCNSNYGGLEYNIVKIDSNKLSITAYFEFSCDYVTGSTAIISLTTNTTPTDQIGFMGALDNTTIIGGLNLISKYDITTSLAIRTPIFFLETGRSLRSIVYNSVQQKYIVGTYDSRFEPWVGELFQYDKHGNIEKQINLNTATGSIIQPDGIFEYQNELYIVNYYPNDVYKITSGGVVLTKQLQSMGLTYPYWESNSRGICKVNSNLTVLIP